MEIVTDGNV